MLSTGRAPTPMWSPASSSPPKRRGRAHRAGTGPDPSGSGAEVGGRLGRPVAQRPDRDALAGCICATMPASWPPVLDVVDALVAQADRHLAWPCRAGPAAARAAGAVLTITCSPMRGALRDVDRLRDWDRRAAVSPQGPVLSRPLRWGSTGPWPPIWASPRRRQLHRRHGGAGTSSRVRLRRRDDRRRHISHAEG